MIRMIASKKCKLGVVITRRDCFKNEGTSRNQSAIINKLNDLAEKILFSWVNAGTVAEEGLLFDLRDVPAIEKRLRDEQVDALFLPHANFGQEEAVARLAKNMGLPLLIWGPRDIAPDGENWRDTDTQCGLFACTKVLARYGVPFSYIENCAVDDPAFEKGVEQFIKVARVVNKFRHLRIGQMSVRPRQFMSVMCNEAELLERFQIEVIPTPAYDIVEAAKKIKAAADPEIEEVLQEICAKGIDMSQLSEEKQKMLAALEFALWRFAKEFSLDALSVECWDVFLNEFGFKPCFILGDLTDRGLPCACENDIHGAIALALALAANGCSEPAFFADLTIRHPTNNNAELLWHCGPFAKSLMKQGCSASIVEEGQGFYPIREGAVTLLRFDGAKGEYRLFADKAMGIDGPQTCGNYLWVEVDDWVRWEKKFIYGPYIHHVTGLYGDYVEVFREACRYIGVAYDSSKQ